MGMATLGPGKQLEFGWGAISTLVLEKGRRDESSFRTPSPAAALCRWDWKGGQMRGREPSGETVSNLGETAGEGDYEVHSKTKAET